MTPTLRARYADASDHEMHEFLAQGEAAFTQEAWALLRAEAACRDLIVPPRAPTTVELEAVEDWRRAKTYDPYRTRPHAVIGGICIIIASPMLFFVWPGTMPFSDFWAWITLAFTSGFGSRLASLEALRVRG